MSAEEIPKPRSDSVLKTLPEERQDEIAEFAQEKSLRETVGWLSEGGIKTAKSSLSDFLTWYRLKQTMRRNQAAIQTLLTEIATEHPEITPDSLHHIGHVFFASLALQKQDHKAWYMTEQIAVRKAQLQLDTKKYEDELKARQEARSSKERVDSSMAGLSPEIRQEIETKNNIL
jgi:hypothetical protein